MHGTCVCGSFVIQLGEYVSRIKMQLLNDEQLKLSAVYGCNYAQQHPVNLHFT